MAEFTRFDKHEDFYKYLDEIIADFKLRVALNHPDLSKCEIRVDLKVIEVKDSLVSKIVASRLDAGMKRVN